MYYDTKEDILKLGEIDPELDALLKAYPIPPADYSDIVAFTKLSAARAEEGIAALGPVPASIKRSELTYTTSDGHNNMAILFQPASPPPSGSPLIMMIHGGGFCIGDARIEETACRMYVEAFGATCVSVGYRLAPRYTFPHAANDCWDALKWVAKSAKEFGADPSKGFVVGGTSAGGNLTAVLAHLARDEDLSPPLTGQYLSIPAVCPSAVMPEKYKHLALSMKQNVDVPVLPMAAVDMFIGAYKPDESDPLYAPMNHPKGHSGLPPAYFQITGMDPLRDEALIYEKILREEYGIKTKMDMYPGLPHAFWSFFPMLKSASKFRSEQVEGMRWLLVGTKPNAK